MGRNFFAKSPADRIREKYNTLKDQQKVAFAAAMAGGNLFITGGGGCGKTHLLKTIFESKTLLRNAIDKPYQCLLLASTGKAAELFGGWTYHRILGIGCGTGINKNGTGFICRKAVTAKADCIILDECSMMSANHYDCIFETIEAGNQKRAEIGLPPTQIIIFGDFCQLPYCTG